MKNKRGKKLAMTEAEFKAAYEQLEEGRFLEALDIANRASTTHSGYQHYTSVSKFCKMVKGKSMWLSRLDSPSLNDLHEANKYGRDWRRMYVGCFSYGRSENALLWKMYCKPNRDAIRVLISQEGMKQFEEYLQGVANIEAHHVIKRDNRFVLSPRRAALVHGGVFDVLYAAVKDCRLGCERCNDLMWNFCHLHIPELEEVIKAKALEGFFKDCEWRGEQETRIFVKTTNVSPSAERLAIRIPDEVLNSMSIVLSPWADTAHCVDVTKRLERLFAEQGLKVPRIRRSYLTGALASWRKDVRKGQRKR